MREINIDEMERKEQLGFYGQFYDTQKKIPSLAFHILQREVGNEINLFLKNNFKTYDVIKFKENFDRYHFQFASKNFEGKKFREFLIFSRELSNTSCDEFWQSVADEENQNVGEHLCSIANRIKVCKQRFSGLNDNALQAKFLSKIFGFDAKSLQNEISYLSDIYVGISQFKNIWSDMTQTEKTNYVAKRYLSTGNLHFDSESANIFCVNFIRNGNFINRDENNFEMQ